VEQLIRLEGDHLKVTQAARAEITLDEGGAREVARTEGRFLRPGNRGLIVVSTEMEQLSMEPGHHDFEVAPDPELSLDEEPARRHRHFLPARGFFSFLAVR
jgi:hypothetical protein